MTNPAAAAADTNASADAEGDEPSEATPKRRSRAKSQRQLLEAMRDSKAADVKRIEQLRDKQQQQLAATVAELGTAHAELKQLDTALGLEVAKTNGVTTPAQSMREPGASLV